MAYRHGVSVMAISCVWRLVAASLAREKAAKCAVISAAKIVCSKAQIKISAVVKRIIDLSVKMKENNRSGAEKP
jgi:hypothetical protein